MIEMRKNTRDAQQKTNARTVTMMKELIAEIKIEASTKHRSKSTKYFMRLLPKLGEINSDVHAGRWRCCDEIE